MNIYDLRISPPPLSNAPMYPSVSELNRNASNHSSGTGTGYENEKFNSPENANYPLPVESTSASMYYSKFVNLY